MKKALCITAILFASAALGTDPAFNNMVNENIKRTMPLMNVKQLNKKLQSKEKIYVLDTRDFREYSISHIENAIYVGYEIFSVDKISIIPKNAAVVAYCSIGYRSEKVGEIMKAAGYMKVNNLFGGIFDWVNNGFPVYDSAGKKTDRVHPYNRSWGKWLTRGTKAYD